MSSQILINFLITAFSLFLTIKIVNTLKDRALKKEKREEQEKKPEESKEVKLLTQIRDILEKQKSA